jgi:hypothetical protein
VLLFSSKPLSSSFWRRKNDVKLKFMDYFAICCATVQLVLEEKNDVKLKFMDYFAICCAICCCPIDAWC